MANVETQYSVEMNYIHNNKETEIKSESIKYITIDNDYLTKNFPVIYVSAKIRSELYDKMLKNIETDTVTLTISKYNTKKDVQVEKNYIKDEYVYLFSDTDSNYKSDLENENENNESYRIVYMGLISISILNYTKKVYNDVISGTMQSIIYEQLESMKKLIIEPFDTNKNFNHLLIPPITGINNLISYLYDCGSFYNTQYIFFIDLNKTCYLMSCNGNGIERKSGDFKSIIIDVESDTNASESKALGMVKDNKAKCYKMTVNYNDYSFSKDLFSSKVFNEIITVDSVGNINKTTFDTPKNSKGDRTVLFRTLINNPKKIKNLKFLYNLGNSVVMITQYNIDTTVVTPDRSYTITNPKHNKQYDGKYILIDKQEIFRREDEKYFTSTVTMKFAKIVS